MPNCTFIILVLWKTDRIKELLGITNSGAPVAGDSNRAPVPLVGVGGTSGSFPLQMIRNWQRAKDRQLTVAAHLDILERYAR